MRLSDSISEDALDGILRRLFPADVSRDEAVEMLELEILESSDSYGHNRMFSQTPPYDELEFDPDSPLCPIAVSPFRIFLVELERRRRAIARLTEDERRAAARRAYDKRFHKPKEEQNKETHK